MENCTFHCKNVIVNSGQCQKRGPQKRKREVETEPADLPKICRYQDRCHLWENCKFDHLNAQVLEGCRRQYFLCWKYPNCQKKECPYVHRRPDEQGDTKKDDKK